MPKLTIFKNYLKPALAPYGPSPYQILPTEPYLDPASKCFVSTTRVALGVGGVALAPLSTLDIYPKRLPSPANTQSAREVEAPDVTLNGGHQATTST